MRFTIRPGEFVGLIGSNGAGKTTLLRVILGLQPAAAGKVRVERVRAVGYVPQKIQLDPDMPLRARDLVGLGLDGHRLGIPLPSRARRKLVDEMLRAVDAERFADARVGNLSGGEQQRILIAHALISRPGLLLLDEPLANLDIASEQEVVALLARIAQGAADRRADLGARDEPAAAGHGPDRLPGGRPGGQRADRRGRHGARCSASCTGTTST